MYHDEKVQNFLGITRQTDTQQQQEETSNKFDELKPSQISKLEIDSKQAIFSFCFSFAFYWHTKEEILSFVDKHAQGQGSDDQPLFIGYILKKLHLFSESPQQWKEMMANLASQVHTVFQNLENNHSDDPILSPWEWWMMTKPEKYECFDSAPLWKSAPPDFYSNFLRSDHTPRDPSLYDNEIMIFERAKSFDDDPNTNLVPITTTEQTTHVTEASTKTIVNDDPSPSSSSSPSLSPSLSSPSPPLSPSEQQSKQQKDIEMNEEEEEDKKIQTQLEENWMVNYQKHRTAPAPEAEVILHLRSLHEERRTAILWDLFVMAVACTGGLDARIQISLLVAAQFLNISTQTIEEFESKFALLARDMLSASSLSGTDKENPIPEDGNRWWKIGLGAAVSFLPSPSFPFSILRIFL